MPTAALPLTPEQRILMASWWLRNHQLYFARRLPEKVDPAEVGSALQSVVERHAGLQAVLVRDDAGTFQQQLVAYSAEDLDIPVVELRGASSLKALINRHFQYTGDFADGLGSRRGLRAALVGDAQGQTLVVAVNHLYADIGAVQIIDEELRALLRPTGQDFSLLPEAPDFAEFVHSRTSEGSSWQDSELVQEYRPAPPLRVAASPERPSDVLRQYPPSGALSGEPLARLDQRARAWKVSPVTLITESCIIAQWLLGPSEDALLWLSWSARERPHLQRLVAATTRFFPVRQNGVGTYTVKCLAGALRDTTLRNAVKARRPYCDPDFPDAHGRTEPFETGPGGTRVGAVWANLVRAPETPEDAASDAFMGAIAATLPLTGDEFSPTPATAPVLLFEALVGTSELRYWAKTTQLAALALPRAFLGAFHEALNLVLHADEEAPLSTLASRRSLY